MPGGEDEHETRGTRGLRDEGGGFCNVSQFISSEPEPVHFPLFSAGMHSSPLSGPDDAFANPRRAAKRPSPGLSSVTH